ncbi:hypothetical protein MMC18_000716 [Xylographa bjoerkii]|nr:hypothetical protein [Xylographa bjoerkii]
MDCTAWWTGKGSPGWWADHDGYPTSWGDKAEEMFRHITAKRSGGANIIFVWLDIKNPNACDPGDQKYYKCSVLHLQDLARQYLLPAGVRVLYGTKNDNEITKGNYSKLASRGLDPAEAIDIDGNYDDVNGLFNTYSSQYNTPTRQRVMSKGIVDGWLNYGNILGELKKVAKSGNFGRIFGWTMIHLDFITDTVRRLITEAHGDDLIYGGIFHYQDRILTKAPLERIKKVVAETDGVHFAQASNNEWPW